jgi:lysyl-tRNA synthetase class 1
MLPNLTDEYDEAERIYFKKQEGDGGLAQMYQLAQVDEPGYMNVPYTLCAVLSQVASEEELEKKAKQMGYDGFDIKLLKERVRLAGKWVAIHGPEYLRFTLLTPDESAAKLQMLDEKQRVALRDVALAVGENADPKTLHKRIYEIARGVDLEPQQLFLAIYTVLIGKERGPKAASFCLSLGADYLGKRFAQAQ